jgi:hypothetical protein
MSFGICSVVRFECSDASDTSGCSDGESDEDCTACIFDSKDVYNGSGTSGHGTSDQIEPPHTSTQLIANTTLNMSELQIDPRSVGTVAHDPARETEATAAPSRLSAPSASVDAPGTTCSIKNAIAHCFLFFESYAGAEEAVAIFNSDAGEVLSPCCQQLDGFAANNSHAAVACTKTSKLTAGISKRPKGGKGKGKHKGGQWWSEGASSEKDNVKIEGAGTGNRGLRRKMPEAKSKKEKAGSVCWSFLSFFVLFWCFVAWLLAACWLVHYSMAKLEQHRSYTLLLFPFRKSKLS